MEAIIRQLQVGVPKAIDDPNRNTLSQSQSHLFKLPPELRNKVYKYVFEPVYAEAWYILRPLQTCRRIRTEATTLAWFQLGKVTLNMRNWPRAERTRSRPMRSRLQALTRSAAEGLQHVEVHILIPDSRIRDESDHTLKQWIGESFWLTRFPLQILTLTFHAENPAGGSAYRDIPTVLDQLFTYNTSKLFKGTDILSRGPKRMAKNRELFREMFSHVQAKEIVITDKFYKDDYWGLFIEALYQVFTLQHDVDEYKFLPSGFGGPEEKESKIVDYGGGERWICRRSFVEYSAMGGRKSEQRWIQLEREEKQEDSATDDAN